MIMQKFKIQRWRVLARFPKKTLKLLKNIFKVEFEKH